ncbi:MAG: cytochrome b/b6 [Rhodospirillaceae bacterium]|jgi:quinol-cytochrome oxidoreductase complex cytochrome b subunit|nr:cytochrome b/b6 [Rhodospirillaceae bacterium]MBT6535187.1 cytochrome b/b6 [Rhodospirillaceae bacterium]
MSAGNQQPIGNGLVKWIDTRLPVFSYLQKEYAEFQSPKNFNWFWNFGAILTFMLVLMMITGIFLAMQYQPNTELAFDSVERIMRDVNFGWLLRYMHANGGTFFFIAVYIHMFRGMYYGSYKNPRELLWILGVVILVLMMATAFMGYVLPWGQMSFWGATVITNLFSAIPLVGDSIVTLLWGGFSVDNATLNRFFALHYLLPFLIFGVVILHVISLHVSGSNNPLGVDPKGPQDTVSFHPYYTMKDSAGLAIFVTIFAFFVFFAPNFFGEPENYLPAAPLNTPAHIVPEWYFLPFFAILRSINFDIWFIEAKLGGVIAMFGAIFVLFILPWLDKSPVRSAKFRPMYKWFFWIFLLDCLLLGWVGGKSPDDFVMKPTVVVEAELDEIIEEAQDGRSFTSFKVVLDGKEVTSVGEFKKFIEEKGGDDDEVPAGFTEGEAVYETGLRVIHLGYLSTFWYFFHFIILLPLLGVFERPKPLPKSISEPVLGGGTAGASATAKPMEKA